jgi:alcohol dehydrogenase, propanol-preferring
VKVAACGVCHTDLHAADGNWPVKPSPPFIPGHEAVGVIAALGPNVTGLKEGDPVGVAWLHDACMNCEYCETGWETLCEQQHNTGYSCNGGFAEYVIGAASFVGHLSAGADLGRSWHCLRHRRNGSRRRTQPARSPSIGRGASAQTPMTKSGS